MFGCRSLVLTVLIALSTEHVWSIENAETVYIGREVAVADSLKAVPPLPSECKASPRVFEPNHWIDDGTNFLFVAEFKCSGRYQIWLLSERDEIGHAMTKRDHFESHIRPKGRFGVSFVVEDVLLVPKHSKQQEMLGAECESPPPIRYVLGTKVLMRGGAGYRGKNIIGAWEVDFQNKRFKSLPVRKIDFVCEFG